MKLVINNNLFNVKSVMTGKDIASGMMQKHFDNTFDGMLFLVEDGSHSFWMKNCICNLDVILDPFCGSGTSVVAAEILNRRWLGIELSPNYCEVARGRVQAFVDEKTKVKIELD